MMAWIESHQTLSRHRKTLEAAGRLTVDRHKLIGHLHELWWWGLDNVGADGVLGNLPKQAIAEAAQWDGDPEEFVDALIVAGFIDETPDGLALHDWYDYAGKLIERRALERERAKRRRASAGRSRNNRSTSAQHPADDRQTLRGTVPNHTEPLDSQKNPSGSSSSRAKASSPPGADGIPSASKAIGAWGDEFKAVCARWGVEIPDNVASTMYGVIGNLLNRHGPAEMQRAMDELDLEFAEGWKPDNPVSALAARFRERKREKVVFAQL